MIRDSFRYAVRTIEFLCNFTARSQRLTCYDHRMAENEKPDIEEHVKIWRKASRSAIATEKTAAYATASAEKIFALWTPDFGLRPNLKADLATFAKEAAKETSAILKVVVDDPDTICADFGLDIRSLSENQAQIVLNEILKARKVYEQRNHEILLRILSAFGGFMLGLLTHLLR